MLYRKNLFDLPGTICKGNPLVQFVEICLKLNAPYEFHSFNIVEEGADCKFRGRRNLHLISKISISYVVPYICFNILCMHVYLKQTKTQICG